MTNIIVLGAMGRMGKSILEIANVDDKINIVGAIEAKNSPYSNHPVFQDNDKYKNLVITDSLEKIIDKADVVIDFTIPKASIANLKIIEDAKKYLVLGTTGFSSDEKDIILQASKNISCVFSPNMSIGVNVFFKIVRDAAKFLQDYDVEIVELHHNKKKDSPSGTAIRLAQEISSVTSKSEKDWIYGREGVVGERAKNEIGIHGVRLGDVVGEHTVYFAENNERLEFTHRAHTRSNFAKGAVLASKWLPGKKPGIYDMADVLGLDK